MEHRFFQTTENASILKRCGVMLLALLFCVSLLLSASAENGESTIPVNGVDLQQKGSVRVLVKDAEDNPVPGGTLQLFLVARVAEGEEGKQFYALTEAFSGWDGTADDLISDQSCAESLAAYVETNRTECLASADNTDGSVTFTDIAPGVYLVRQSAEAEGYETMLPFLAFLPVVEDGRLVYDIEASPKPMVMRPPGAVEVTAEKTVEVISGSAPQDTVFSFVLKALDQNAPLPRNASAVYDQAARSMTVSRTGPGEICFGSLTLLQSDAGKRYEYEVREVQGSAAHYSYDFTVYKLTVSVAGSGDGGSLIVSTTITDGSGNTVDQMIFRNYYEGGSTPDIPRTGQLWWPVLVMLPAGCLLVAVGVLLRRRKESPEEELL